tara:strand:+ start:2205 stop:2888 length:684 start_codon:yes stop_codon:yes gene_type:complete
MSYIDYIMDKKSGNGNNNIVEPTLNAIKAWAVPRLPAWVTTYNLTLVSIVWSSLIIFAGYMSRTNACWLFLVIFCIMLHIVTDILDGAVGRYRNTGAVKWGYFMDHTMDTILLSSVFVALFFALPAYRFTLFISALSSLQLMVTSFLSRDDKGQDISVCIQSACTGPVDGLILMILLILYVIMSDKKPSVYVMYAFNFVLLGVNIFKIYAKQRQFHYEDMIIKYAKK